ncbi:Aste57867_21959 [Aphanomyces stellatus]|uniref:Aste57867_21959 protein n=1 Tax=Aphanomyces stellatus TaxID=120398 RepID=A0A485LJK3_9STRA|nr:hypothetical protein As57867_021890 [Aphanomyces stellatus]VFT98627.1 Aste57867_21959 [Aphanomyces stellatus]
MAAVRHALIWLPFQVALALRAPRQKCLRFHLLSTSDADPDCFDRGTPVEKQRAPGHRRAIPLAAFETAERKIESACAPKIGIEMGRTKVNPRVPTALRRTSSYGNLPIHGVRGALFSTDIASKDNNDNPVAPSGQGPEHTTSQVEGCKVGRMTPSVQEPNVDVGGICKIAHDADIVMDEELGNNDDDGVRFSIFGDPTEDARDSKAPRPFTKHTFKKFFSLPTVVTTALEKRSKALHPSLSSLSHDDATALLEVRSPSPVAILDNPAHDDALVLHVSYDPWTASCAAFRRLKFIVWRGGVPGFHVHLSDSGSIVVDNVTGPLAWTEGVRAGDELVAIGGVSVVGMDASAAMGMLHMSDIPTVIRLRAPVATLVTTYAVTVQPHQKLGVTFASDGPDAVAVVNRITDRADAIARACGISCGDVLVDVAGQDAVTCGLAAAMHRLAALPKPLTLTFQRLVKTDVLPTSIVPANSTLRMSTFLSPRPSERSTAARLSIMATTVDDSRAELFILWRSGPLGVTFVECAATGLPKVNRLTGKGRTPMIDRVQHGYTLATINGDATPPSFDQACDLLARSEKPILLLFRPPPPAPLLLSPVVHVSLISNAVSPRSVAVHMPGPNEYEILWERAPLGLVLGMTGGRSLPYVKRIKSDCTLRLKRNIVADALVAVNNIATDQLAPHALVELFRAAPFPVVLRFRPKPVDRTVIRSSNDDDDDIVGRPSSDDDDANEDDPSNFGRSYNLVWQGGELGLTFEPVALAVAVKRVLPGGCARQSNMVHIGDVLTSVNGRGLAQMSFRDTMMHLLELRKPVILGFERDSVCKFEDDEEDDEDIPMGPTQL